MSTVVEKKVGLGIADYLAVAVPPADATKTIQAGRQKGKSDINPQWRYEAMTKKYGLIGFGWKYEVTKQWREEAAKDEVLVFTNILLFVKHEGAWSDGVFGTGGNHLISNEKNGLYNSDDAYKMALTDALSVAMKQIGVGSEVYRGLFDGKYSTRVKEQQPAETQEDRDNKRMDGLKKSILPVETRERLINQYYNVLPKNRDSFYEGSTYPTWKKELNKLKNSPAKEKPQTEGAIPFEQYEGASVNEKPIQVTFENNNAADDIF